jgi:uncharacterized alpha-E superfamily protein
LESEAQKSLLHTVTHLTGTYPGFLEEEETVTVEERLSEIHKLICDGSQDGSILSTANNLIKAMYAVRDRWTVDNWRIIDDIEDTKRKLALLEPDGIRHVFTLLDQMNGSLLSFLEMNRQSMYRGEGWLMYRIGQLIEEISLELTQYRALLTFQYEESVEFEILEALLTSNQNLSNYRSVYRTYFDINPAIDLLFLNKQNPISILSQLEQLQKFVEQLPQKENGDHNSELSNLAFQCYSIIRLTGFEELTRIDSDLEFRPALDKLCEELSARISKLSTALTANYFSHSTYQYQGRSEGPKIEV